MTRRHNQQLRPGRRINVIGTTGSGKTTVSRAISEQLGIPHIEMDALFWKPNWKETPDSELLPEVDRQTDQPAWVLDGNYSRTRPTVWPKADTVVWLDYPFLVIFAQLLRRTIGRAWTKDPMWGGCIEDWKASFFSKDSILLWCITTHFRRKRNYPKALAKPEHAHLRFIHLRSRRQTRRWLDSLA